VGSARVAIRHVGSPAPAPAGVPEAAALKAVAAFDFDGTLTRRDTLAGFVGRVAGWPRVALAFAAESPRIAGVVLGRADRDDTKQRFLGRVLGGRTRDAIAAAGRSYGDHLAVHKIRPEMRERIAWHRAEGHEVVIVSATLDAYLQPVAEALAIDALLCSRLEYDAHGRCTGRLIDGNCRGPAKLARLEHYLGTEPAELWAYGDSAGDDEMLARADHPIRV
jgi:HAD superfamily hydrolase (TIGR01490 family)